MAFDTIEKENLNKDKKIHAKDNFNALCVGIGGTGVIRASMILGWCALQEGFKVRTAETHGMSQRGGSVLSYLRFGKFLEGPFMIEGDLNVLLAFEISEALRNLHFASKDTFVLASKNCVVPPSVLTHNSLKIDRKKCVGCGNCVAHCLPNQIYRESNNNHFYTLMKGPTRIVINGACKVFDSCTGCVHCIIDKVCPFGAIEAFNEWEYPTVELIEKDVTSVVKNVIIIDAEKIASDAGNILAANIVLLGVLVGVNVIPITDHVMKETIKNFVPKKQLDINLKAFDEGLNIGSSYKKK